MTRLSIVLICLIGFLGWAPAYKSRAVAAADGAMNMMPSNPEIPVKNLRNLLSLLEIEQRRLVTAMTANDTLPSQGMLRDLSDIEIALSTIEFYIENQGNP